MTAKIDLTGLTFNKLTVISEADRSKHGQVLWACKCGCGKTTIVVGRDLRTGHPKSCGCFRDEAIGKLNKTHGLSDHPLYGVWGSMKKRCFNTKSLRYQDYGGRGITVCDRWKDSFENFYSDVIQDYQKGLELDRINNDGNYEPDNVRWVTPQQNCSNTRSRKDTSSKYKGVSWNKDMAKWVSNIMKEGKPYYLGSFICEKEAAKAYNLKAKELFGEHAYLNVIEN